MNEHLSRAWIEHFRESAREGVLPTAKGTEALLAHIDAQYANIRDLEVALKERLLTNMSANDKAAATYGRQPMTAAETLAKHRFEEETRCICGWDVPVADSYEDECRTWEAHQAEMLEPLLVAREDEAYDRGYGEGYGEGLDSE